MDKQAVPVERVRLVKEQVIQQETVSEEVRQQRIEAEGPASPTTAPDRPGATAAGASRQREELTMSSAAGPTGRGRAAEEELHGSHREDETLRDGRRDETLVAETVPADRAERLAREDVVLDQRDAFGGVKVGSAFFGWLTATGMAVLLTALVAAAGTAVGVATSTNVDQAASDASRNPQSVGLVGGILLLVILFVAYFCGGYVAGRMARFDGAKQGLAVWLWAVVIALVVAGLAAVAGSKYDVLSQLNSFPRIPVDGGTLSKGGIIALVVVAVASLLGALLGGLAGMHYHRKVDRAALDV
ncbi:hypothetical protein [Terrabacter sp. BE26]|uniref:hypothetical protein n=1 Tax=Terrabacter sp. BE26 TaxID=2898152 RepID=UPI0035BE7C46